MQKQERYKQILEVLLHNADGVTGEMLAKKFNISSRTIRSDIKSLQELFVDCQTKILAAPRRGYKIEQRESTSDLLKLVGGENGKVGFTRAEDQQNYIISRFLECCLRDISITQMMLADEMYVGLSTVKSYLKSTRARFEVYDIQLVQYKREGLRIEGAEGDLRSFFVDYLHEVQDKRLCDLLFDRIHYDRMEEILSQAGGVRSLQLTDSARRDLAVQTALSVQRSLRGHSIECRSSVAQKLEAAFEYNAAKEISNKILDSIDVDIPYSEVFYLTQCLLTGKKLLNVGTVVNDEHIKDLVEKILVDVDEKFSLDFTADEYLKDGLALHLRIAIARVKFRVNIRNELLGSVKKEYPLAFQIAVYAAKMVRDIDHIEFNENEIGYIALHFGASMSRNSMAEEERSKTVYVVCSAGLGVSVLMKAKLKENFRNSIHVIDILPAYKLTEKMQEEADYIISTVPLSVSSPKIIRVNHMLGADDVEKIRRIVFNRENELDANVVRQFFRPEGFYVNRSFHTRDECLNFLTDDAIRNGWMDAAGKSSVFEREHMSSTAIGDFVAIPHTLLTGHMVSNISVLILEEPVQWEEFPVRVVFLLNIEQIRAPLWEKIFLKLYSFIKEYHGLESLLKHKSYEQFIEEFIAVL